MPLRSLALACWSGLAALALAGPALAAYPDKPIKLIVPFPPGGGADVMARSMAQRLGEELGQQIVIDNRGGAGGAIAAEAVAKSPGDGYTLLFGTMGVLAINPSLYSKLRYDPVVDFAPVSLTHANPRALIVGPSLAAKTLAELIALAKAKPDALTYGSAGNGSSSHLAGALFENVAEVKMLHVPYKGSAPLMNDLLAGRVDMVFDAYVSYVEHIKAGKLRVFAVTAKQRLKALPQVPSMAELGLKSVEVTNWLGVLAPAGTPRDVVATLNRALDRAMATPALRQQLVEQGIDALHSSPEEFSALIRGEIPKWAETVRRSGATIE